MTQETLTVDPQWATRPHHGIEPIRTYVAGKPVFALPLELCEVDDPCRVGFWRGEWWRIAGDQPEPVANLPTGRWF